MVSVYGFQFKGIKRWRGHEGEGFQGYIFYNGKKVGWYNDSADGGEEEYNFSYSGDKEQEMYEKLNAATDKYFEKYPLKGLFANMTPDAGLFFSEIRFLIDLEYDYKKCLKKGKPYMWLFENAKKHDVYIISSVNENAVDLSENTPDVCCLRKITSLDDFIIE